MSIRELTRLQAANGSALVGADLDEVAHDTALVLNDLQPKHLARNSTRKVWCIGHSPSIATVAPYKLPWMKNFNGPPSACTLETPAAFVNPWRFKGDWNDDIDPTTGADGNLWSMEIGVAVERPHRLRRFVVSALTDADYVNSFRYNNPGPPVHGIDQSVYDMTVLVQADDVYAAGKRNLSLVPAVRRAFKLDGHMLARYAPMGGTDTGLPPYPTGSAQGLMFDTANHDGTDPLDIPIPAKTKLRFIVQVPEYAVAAWSGWGAEPWRHCLWGITIWADEDNE